MTAIEWTDRTWNPVRGCSRVSEGCRNCYAERQAARFSNDPFMVGTLPPLPFDGFAYRASGEARWTGRVELIPEKLSEPLRWRKPSRVFVNSMSDLFHESLAFEKIAAVFGVMAAAPQHTFQVLTKRPLRMREFFDWIERHTRAHSTVPIQGAIHYAQKRIGHPALRDGDRVLSRPWPLPNVHLGVSVEDQATADERIPFLFDVPAALRFVSYEPALGPVDFTSIDIIGQRRKEPHPDDPIVRLDALRGHVRGPDDMLGVRLDWVIVGGESGPNARPFDLEWARSVIAQGRTTSVPTFFKQAGAWPFDSRYEHALGLRDADAYTARCSMGIHHPKGGDPSEWPEDLRVRELPK